MNHVKTKQHDEWIQQELVSARKVHDLEQEPKDDKATAFSKPFGSKKMPNYFSFVFGVFSNLIRIAENAVQFGTQE